MIEPMNEYAFILGRKNLLSIAELCQVLHQEVLQEGKKGEAVEQPKIIDITRETLTAALPYPLKNPQESLNRLGGTIKIAKVFAETSTKEEIPKLVSAFLIEKFKDHPTKIPYGISLYSFTDIHENFLKKTLISIKKDMVAADLKSRFINNNFRNLESAAIYHEKLLQKGAEVIIIQGKYKFVIAETQALQDFENYGHRDFDRPMRDPRLGMLPPKVAQIMINLAGLDSINQAPNPNRTLYDPFAGVGTVLTEGLMMGYSVVGSDISDEVIQKAQKNLDWTRNQVYVPGQKARLFTKDATLLNAKDLPETIDAIITESWLGPAVSHLPPTENIHKTFEHIRETLLRFFKAIHRFTKPGTPVVISLLTYRAQGRFLFIENLVEKISAIGFEIEEVIPQEIQIQHGLRGYPRKGLIYDRPDQIVAREIWKFVRR